MYQESISRKRPGCIVFLLDRSDSMRRPWNWGRETLAQGAAAAINGILMELCIRATKGAGLCYHYFDVGIFGYGTRPAAGGEGVESAFAGRLANRTLVPIGEIRDNHLGVREVPSVDLGASVQMPVWVEPVYGYRTPMCQAIAVAGEHVYEWTQAHQDSFPPIIVNITDGMVTDDPLDGASLGDWAKRLTSISTRDGQALLFNVFVAPQAASEVVFPASGLGLPEPGPALFDISSPLPGPMIRNAASDGVPTVPGARGFAFNVTDPAMLVKILEIGTRITTRGD